MEQLTPDLQIRKAGVDDFNTLADVMFDAVRNGPSDYTQEQRVAWVPQPRTGLEWNQRLAAQTVFLGESNQAILGFISLTPQGYIDLAFIRPSARGTGLFRKIYGAVEDFASQNQLQRLRLHASLTARPAFTAVGFSIVKRETVGIGNQLLDRFEMEKALS